MSVHYNILAVFAFDIQQGEESYPHPACNPDRLSENRGDLLGPNDAQSVKYHGSDTRNHG